MQNAATVSIHCFLLLLLPHTVWWSLVFGLLSPDMSHHRCDKEIALHCTVGVCWQRSHCESRAMQLVIMRPIHCFTAAVPESLHVPIVPVVLFNISYLVNSTSAPHPPGSTLTFQYTHLVLGTYMHLVCTWNPYGSVSAGREIWLFRVIFFQKVEDLCVQTWKDSFDYSIVPG